MSLPPEPEYALESNDHNQLVRVGAVVTYTLVRTNIVVVGDGRVADIPTTFDAIGEEYATGHPYTQDPVVAPRAHFMVFAEAAYELRRVAEPTGFQPSTERHSVSIEWKLPGTHMVKCFVDVPEPWANGRKRRFVASREQTVITPEKDNEDLERYFHWIDGLGIRSPAWERLITTPEQHAVELFRTLEAYDAVERSHPTRLPDPKEAFEQMRQRMLQLGNALYDLLIPLSGQMSRRYSVHAVHAAAVQNVELHLFIAIGAAPRVDRFEVFGAPARGGPGSLTKLHHVNIVDWTDASGKAYRGTYSGIHHDKGQAIVMALHHWRSANDYPEGTIRFGLPPPFVEALLAAKQRDSLTASDIAGLKSSLGLDLASAISGDSLVGSFETGGDIDVAAALDKVAFAAGMLALVSALAAPIPGSRAVAGLVWASMVAGTASSTIRIVGRHHEGITDWKADTLDGLSILGNLLMVPGAKEAWRRGSQVMLREVAVLGVGKGVLRRTLIGQISVDLVQGVLVAAGEIQELRLLLADPTKDPVERVKLALAALGRMAATGALVTVSVHGNLVDVASLEGPGGALMRDNAKRWRIEDGDEIDLLDGPGTPGHTRDGHHRGRANVDPPATPPMLVRRPRLTPEAELKLGTLDDAQRAKAMRMLDADEQCANLLFHRFGTDALDAVDAFESVWTRWRALGYPEDMLRTYAKHTGTDGIRYFARVPGADGGRELLNGAWAARQEEDFHSICPDAGHSVARHGAHVPAARGEKLELRVKTGIAPDGLPSMTKRSSKFSSFNDWLEAYDSAYITLKEQFGLDRNMGPIVASNGKRYPKAGGYIKMRDLDNPTKEITRPLGEGYEGIADGTQSTITLPRPDGSPRTGIVFPTTVRIPHADIEFVRVTLGWTGREWIIMQLFPAKLPSPGTNIGLSKDTVDTGKDTIL